MLSLMRKHAGSWIIKFLLGAVIVAFIPFGYGIYQDRREGTIASVDGEPISFAEYDQIYNNLIEQTRQNLGSSFNEEMIKMLGLKDRALNQLIDHKLMLAEARRLKYRVSEQEVADEIAKIEAFQTAGFFDNRRYEYILNHYRMAKEDFEARQKESMLIEKVRSLIADSLRVSDAEARHWYLWNNASLNVDYVLFEFGKHKAFKISNEEITVSMEDAARLNVSAVALSIFVGSENERRRSTRAYRSLAVRAAESAAAQLKGNMGINAWASRPRRAAAR